MTARPRTVRSAPGSPDPALVREIHRRLRTVHGPLEPPRRLDPLEELILTILSQNTSDVNRDRAYRALRSRYPTWEAVAAAPEPDLVETIRPGGLAATKAPRILRVLREIREREGRLDLSWMAEAPDEDVEAYLTSLPGVGRKTAACVLAFALGRPVLPVDTHVHRVATRLGLLPERTQADRAHGLLADAVPPRDRVSMHVGLIRHGRATCRAARPRCDACPLRDLCPSAAAFLEEAPPPPSAGSPRS